MTVRFELIDDKILMDRTTSNFPIDCFQPALDLLKIDLQQEEAEIKSKNQGKHIRPNLKAELVVARYNESLTWILGTPRNIDRITIYNKGNDYQDIGDPRVHVTQLPNVGREAHAFLTHIVENYDSLADVTFTVQGNALFHAPDLFGLLQLKHTIPTSLTPYYSPHFPKQNIKDKDLVIKVGPYEIRYGLFMHFGSRNPKSNLRWFEEAWEEVFDCPLPVPYYFGYGAMWAIPKENILHRSREFYVRLLVALDSQGPEYKQFTTPIDAWSIEGMWHAILMGPAIYPGKIK